MKKNLLFVLPLAFTLVTSCGKSGGGGGESASNQEEGATISSEDTLTGLSPISSESAPGSVPSLAVTFQTDIRTFGFSSSGEQKLQDAQELIKAVIGSEEFRSKVLNHKVKGKKTFVDNDGLTNEQIYQKILEGSEKLTPGDNNSMDLEVEYYYKNNKTVGYTYPSKVRVWMNGKYFNKNSPALVTTNLMHEWLHKIGFTHAKSNTSTRKYSVPYAVGYIMRDLAKKLR